jgi:protein MAK16
MFLYMKTIERAHTPAKLWERIKLSQNYTKALEQVTEQLEFFPKALQHRNKQRLTKIYQYLVRSRKLKLKKTSKLVALNTKQEKLEGRREEKALKAAKLESSIKQELMERLKRGTYGDIYNFPEVQYNEALDEAQAEDEEAAALEETEDAEEGYEEVDDEDEDDEEEEYEEEEEEEEYEDDEDVGLVEYVANFDEGDEEEEEDDDIEDDWRVSGGGGGAKPAAKGKRKAGDAAGSSKKGKAAKRPVSQVEIEYEDEEENGERQTASAVATAW